MSFRLLPAACSAFVAICSFPSHAQEIEQVDVFRDAAVVTWTAGSAGGSGAMARSFHSASPSDAMVFPTSADGIWGALNARSGTWSPDVPDAASTAVKNDLDNARLELALKRAQLELVEEDIALLRANRKVTGTAEALLVEDLVDVAQWMHGEMKDLLFRRVELNMEIEAPEEEGRGPDAGRRLRRGPREAGPGRGESRGRGEPPPSVVRVVLLEVVPAGPPAQREAVALLELLVLASSAPVASLLHAAIALLPEIRVLRATVLAGFAWEPVPWSVQAFMRLTVSACRLRRAA